MDEPVHALRLHGRDHGSGARRVARFEGGAVGRIDHAGDVQDGIRAGDEFLELTLVFQRAEYPFDTVPQLLGAAREGPDPLPVGQRFREHGLADETGRASDCDESQRSTI